MKCTILFLAANPRDTVPLALAEECAAIEQELRSTSGRDDFAFLSRWAVSVDDLMRYLNELSPAVLHFSGHGLPGDASTGSASGASRRDVESPQSGSILLQNSDRSQDVGEQALARMIASASPTTRLVVLNACHSDAVAASLCQVVDCVVGVVGSIGDDAARSFAVAFYRALGYRRSVANAVRQASATLDGKREPGEIVTCRPRDGIDVDQLFLAAPSAPPPSGPPSPIEIRDVADRAAPQPARSGAWPAAAECYDLFLTHPPANRSSARALYDLLQPDVRVFLASRAPSTSDYPEQTIATAQRASHASMLLISPQADAVWYLSDEVLAAIAAHRGAPSACRLLLVLLEPGIALPRCLAGVTAIDAVTVGLLPGIAAQLRTQVAAHRRGAVPGGAPPPGAVSDGYPRGNHLRLYERLHRAGEGMFEQILACTGVPRDSIASRGAAHAERALDLAQLAALDPSLGRRISTELDCRAPWTRR
jgi:hypothetical protein